VLRNRFAGGLALAFLLGALGIVSASERDETVVTVQVTSADHEIQEGYFSLGQDTTLVVKPGTDLHKFLSRQRGKKITITMTETAGRTLSRIDR
jgi:hypothetical protein